MKKYTIGSLFFIFASFVLFASVAQAQYVGAYSDQKEEKKEETLLQPIPQIFSSQVSSTGQAKKLDELYDTLHASLWNYAISDINYQKKLYDLLEDERFKTTRYSGEFAGALKQALADLNEHNKNIKSNLMEAETTFNYVRERVREEDKKTLDELWTRKIKEFEKTSETYFKMQHSFLKTYRWLVGFILEQSGGYYYDSADRALHFYDFASYEYYSESIDRLHKTSYEQKKLLKKYVPSGVDLEILK